eukprot:TRINITY_DN1253_c0_g2_i1.p1 TRINITY_DN1253_c0_g2~~TRINITY_DN1253_c0_g2_i1.p1  ORF type:complete len:109 (-),score=8.23 TRINITY_DN1253_c0_g2_i1:215-541(-)
MMHGCAETVRSDDESAGLAGLLALTAQRMSRPRPLSHRLVPRSAHSDLITVRSYRSLEPLHYPHHAHYRGAIGPRLAAQNPLSFDIIKAVLELHYRAGLGSLLKKHVT